MSIQRDAVPDVSTEACCAPVRAAALSQTEAGPLARVFKALADPVRLRILSIISAAEDGEVCVCDLTEGFAVSGPTVSHHLRVLREAGLIEGDRRGTWIYYRTTTGALDAAMGALLSMTTSTAVDLAGAVSGGVA